MSSSTFYNSQSLVGIGSVGIGTTSPLAALHVQGSQYYTGDSVRSAAHLVPNQTNAPAIQNWINFSTSVANNPARSWWATSQTPTFGNVNLGVNQFCSGGIFIAPNSVLFVPTSTKVLTYYPDNGTYTTAVIPSGSSYSGGILLPTGNVLFLPQTSNVGMFNPVNSTYSIAATLPNPIYTGVLTSSSNVTFFPLAISSNIISYNFVIGIRSNVFQMQGSSSWSPTNGSLKTIDSSCLWNGVAWSPGLSLFVAVGYSGTFNSATSLPIFLSAALLPNGNVIATNLSAGNVIQFNPTNFTSSNIIVGTDGFVNLILAPNGNVIGTPASSNIVVINPTLGVSSTLITGVPSFASGCMTSTGNIIFVPASTYSNIGIYDPLLNQYSNSTPTGTNFTSATLMPSGKVIMGPGSGLSTIGVLTSSVPIDQTFCASPYFNKS